MPAARILIITSGPLCRNPRVLKEATALGQVGYDVTVLSVRNHAPSEAHDTSLLHGAPFQRKVVDLLGGPGNSRFQHRLLSWVARKSVVWWGAQPAHALGPASALLRVAMRHAADLTIVHNEVAHYVGTRLMRTGRRVVADIEDWHSEDLLPADRASRPLRLLRQIERTLLHDCVHTTTTSHALAHALHACYGGRRPHVIANAFPLQPLPPREIPRDEPTFFWFSQTLGPGRGLDAFVTAWAATARPSRLVLLGEARADYVTALLGRVPADRRASVSILPLVAPGELPTLIARHDIGLALEDSRIRSRDLTITNKILQYLNAGLMVVASETEGQREVLANGPEAGVILPTHDPADVTRQLDELLADRSAILIRQRAARRLAEETYCWERQAPRLIGLVESALARVAPVESAG